MKLQQKPVPTLFALFLILMAVAAGIFLIRQGGTGLLKAAPETKPQEVKITNITANSFTVSWLTEKETTGFLKYGATNHLDRTDSQSKPGRLHYFEIQNLQPETRYYFKIGSGEDLYDLQGKPYQATTAPFLEQTPLADAAYGQVFKPDNSPSEENIVYLTMANASPLSALTQSDGQWTIPLNMARKADLSGYLNYDRETALEEIFIQAGQWGVATALVTAKNDSPVPAITLGQTYDFRLGQSTNQPNPPSAGFNLNPLDVSPAVNQSPFIILNPEEKENINSQRPEFQGSGPRGETIILVLESSPAFEVEVLIDQNGQWHWVPPTNLEPGLHTLTISLADGATVSRSFSILSAGEDDLPAFTATPSAEASPTSIPSPTPTNVPRTSLPSTDSGVPESGYLTPTILFVILGIALTFSGLLINFKLNF